ncbi:hypothetical protein [Cyanobium sp. WAJ14-Wanaka]|uniref:hypothetical protein n=1 Tax=Cyanobium sp. WAJ14-Wanaka TaxID=2823725 RepID=UPI0020CE7902|nr:hypothetical protein [Cyanobium sp. WAJ14-Wanaka]MCP9774934.1 hypothetical protein [Cyanobium sp. WAJ14-Wanaka]
MSAPEHRPRRFDRRHLLLLIFALACIGGLVLWVAELDLVLDQTLTPAAPNQPVQKQPAPSKPATSP